MKVKDIITLAAHNLNVDLTDECTSTLLHCFNMVLDELAVDYYPLTYVEEVCVSEGGIFYKDFQKSPIRILNVGWRKRSSYRLESDRIVINDPIPGSYVRIKYEGHPGEKGLDDDIEYPDFMRDTLIFGVCAEYCVTEGQWEIAYAYSKRYRYEIRNNHLRFEAMNSRNSDC